MPRRPPKRRAAVAIGVDIGGTNLRVALVDPTGKLVRSVKQPIASTAPKDLLAQLGAIVEGFPAAARRAPLAVGIAGFLLTASGVVINAPNLGWNDVPFGRLLRRKFGRPVRLVNDLDAITYGEARRGAGKGATDVACVFVGTGVGLGVVSGGRIVEGADGVATELGHIKVESPVTGRVCGCGERGCLEAYTSGRHLPDLLAERVAAGEPSPLFHDAGGDPQKLRAQDIEQAARHGEVAASRLWDDIGERLGFAIGNLVTLWNPRVLILGGGVLQSAPSLQRRTLKVFETVAWRTHRERVSIRPTKLGDDAGLIGAGLLAHDA